MLDRLSHQLDDMRPQSFSVAYEFPVVFTRDAFNPGNHHLVDVVTRREANKLRRRHRSSHLEAETYIWDILPQELRTASRADDIAREPSFCVKELVG